MSTVTISATMDSQCSQPQLNIAIFVIGFNRGLLTLQLLRNIASMVDIPIFLALDGPRDLQDRFQQDQLVSAIGSSGLHATVMIGNENRGCARGVINSIDVLFRETNSTIGIILEDDCWPTISFFDFIEENASKLEDEWLTITGQCIGSNPDGSLTFSSYPLIHGWAISRKNWNQILRGVISTESVRFKKDIPWKIYKFFQRTMSKVDMGQLDTWDAHFTYASWGLSQLSVSKMSAFVVNVGELSSRDPKTDKRIHHRHLINSPKVENNQRDSFLERSFFGATYLRALVWSSLNRINALLRLIKGRKLSLGERIRRDLELTTGSRYFHANLSSRYK